MGFKDVAVAAVVAGTLLLTGCGDSGSPSPSFSSTPSVGASQPMASEGSGQGSDRGVGDVLEKNADGGIWFDEEPQDPLEKLVFASQRFVDEPLQLRPIEGEGVDPAFLGKPDICDPQAVERLASIGIEQSTTMPTYMDNTIYFCSYNIENVEGIDATLSINQPNFPVTEQITKRFTKDLVEINGGGPEFECIAVYQSTEQQILYNTFTRFLNFGGNKDKCKDLALIRQLFINVQGGEHVEI